MNFDEIAVDGKPIVESGSFVIPAGSRDTTFKVDDVVIQVEFESRGLASSISSRSDGPKKSVFTLIDFNNPLGTALTLESVVTKNGSSYDLHIMIHSIGDDRLTRLLSYSLFKS